MQVSIYTQEQRKRYKICTRPHTSLHVFHRQIQTEMIQNRQQQPVRTDLGCLGWQLRDAI